MRVGLVLLLVFGLGVAPACAQPAPGHPGLGVRVADMPPGAPVHGAWVRQVVPDSAASAAGIRPDDVIVAFDGQPIDGMAALRAAVGRRPPGTQVRVQLLRPAGAGAERLTLEATLGGTAPPPLAQAPPAVEAPSAPAPAPAPTGTVRWTRFTDPREQAFSLEVPEGWRVAGGMVRHSAVGVSPFVRALSPDGTTYLLLGDPGMTLFATPVNAPWAPRRAERSQFVAVSGDVETVLRYLPGAAFADDYVRHEVSRFCSAPQLGAETARPDLAAGPWAGANPNAHHDGGSVGFSCSQGSAPARGEMAAATYIYPSPRRDIASFWAVDMLAGWIAPPDGAATARALTAHLVETFRTDPAWRQRQQQVMDAVARHVVALTEAQMQHFNQVIAQEQNRMHQMDVQFQQADRVINGTSPYVDQSGNVHQFIDNTKRYQWIAPGGQTLGTNTPTAPGVGWTQMHELPPQ